MYLVLYAVLFFLLLLEQWVWNISPQLTNLYHIIVFYKLNLYKLDKLAFKKTLKIIKSIDYNIHILGQKRSQNVNWLSQLSIIMYVLQNLGAMFVAIGDLKSLKMHSRKNTFRFHSRGRLKYILRTKVLHVLHSNSIVYRPLD